MKVNLLNFMATFEGLKDQMLGVTVKQERPDLEEKRQKLVVQDAQNKKSLKEIEDQILELLAKSEGNILDDAVLISTLAEAKITSNKIEIQVKQALKTKAVIDKGTKMHLVLAAYGTVGLRLCWEDATSCIEDGVVVVVVCVLCVCCEFLVTLFDSDFFLFFVIFLTLFVLLWFILFSAS